MVRASHGCFADVLGVLAAHGGRGFRTTFRSFHGSQTQPQPHAHAHAHAEAHAHSTRSQHAVTAQSRTQWQDPRLVRPQPVRSAARSTRMHRSKLQLGKLCAPSARRRCQGWANSQLGSGAGRGRARARLGAGIRSTPRQIRRYRDPGPPITTGATRHD